MSYQTERNRIERRDAKLDRRRNGMRVESSARDLALLKRDRRIK